MTRYINMVSVAVAILFFASSIAYAAGETSETGMTGMSFLSIPPSSSTAAMGGLSSAYGIRSSSMWSNPSLLAGLRERNASFTHTEWIEGIRQEFASFAGNTEYGAFGLSVQLFDSGDIEGRSEIGDYLGTYSIKNVAVSLAYARELNGWLDLGVTYKQLYEKISEDNAGGFAVDAGLTAETPLEGVRLSLVGRNYGRMGELRNDRTELPSDIVLGGAYMGMVPQWDTPFVVVADAVFPRYGDAGLRAGITAEPVERFAVRIGYRTDSDIEDFSAGIGFVHERFALDVSYTPMQQGFDNALRFTIDITGF